MKKKYLDTTVFTYAALYADSKSNNCKNLLIKIGKNQVEGFTSLITWDELIYIVKKTLGREISIEEGEKFLKLPNLKFIDLNIKIIQKAQELITTYSLNPRDAIHAATAIVNNIAEIISDDSDFDVIKEIKRIPLEAL